MKDVNAHYYFNYSLLKKIQYVGYEIDTHIYTSYDDCTIDCTIWCKPYTRDLKVCIKASYINDWYWNVNTGKLEHMSGYSFRAQLGPDGLWRSMTSSTELVEYLKEVSTYK